MLSATASSGTSVATAASSSPGEELAAVATDVPLEAVALSISATAPKAYAFALALDLRRKLPERVALWIGGSGAPDSVPGAVRINDIDSLDQRLAGFGPASMAES